MKNKVISIIGSTGSIGTQSLDVIRKAGFKVSSLAAKSNIELLEKQIREFGPKIAAVYDEDKALILRENIKDTFTRVSAGMDGLLEVAREADSDMAITSLVGMIGIRPTIEAIKAKKNIGLANKETLVCAGEIITKEAEENGVKILPVDSEHSAIFQCLQGSKKHSEIKKIILTASGGPFFGKTRNELKNVTAKDALKHPNWNMGAKITIDSATLMNKGLEFIEAFWLFNVSFEQIEVIIHRESIIHSMVEYVDNSIIAQMGTPDMRVPIQYAITYPERFDSPAGSLDLLQYQKLTFYKPDEKTFKCLKVCKDAIKKGGTMPAAVNAANEEAVSLFLEGKISFTDIFDLVEDVYNTHKPIKNPKLKDIFDTEKSIRDYINIKAMSL